MNQSRPASPTAPTSIGSQLKDKILNRSAVIAPIGLGYVGLPLAFELAKKGFKVRGIENNPERCSMLNRGTNYIQDIGPDQLETFQQLTRSGKLTGSTDFSPLDEADVILICVPTPLTKNKEPDLSYINHVLEQIARHFSPGKLIVLESTTYPGNTEEVALPKLSASGLKVGQDFFLAFSPERIDPGNRVYHTANTTKLVGGVTPQCTELAALFYRQVVGDIVPVSSPRVAEMTKLFENVYRSVNIALVNELTLLCERMKINVYEVIQAANSKPYGFQAFWPGPGVGGHCIPLDPYYLAWKGKEYDLHARFIELAGEINENMPRFVTSKVGRILNQQGKSIKGSNILQLGITYKKDVADYRESPSVVIYEELAKSGARVSVADPTVDHFLIREHSPVYERSGPPVKTLALDSKLIREADLVLLTTDHSNFPYEFIAQGARTIFDTRNAFANRGIVRDNILNLSTEVEPQ